MLPAMWAAPTSSRMTSAPPSSRTCANASSAPGRSPPAPRPAAGAPPVRTFATTRAPIAAPIWTAAVPTPPLAPFTSRTSPAARPACITIASNAVRNACGTAAARSVAASLRDPHQLPLDRQTRSAIPPPPTRPNARSPTAATSRRRRPRPPAPPPRGRPTSARPTPAAPDGVPSRWSTSAGFTPANGGAITTSKRPGTGSRPLLDGDDLAAATSRGRRRTSRGRVRVEPPAGDVAAAHERDARLRLACSRNWRSAAARAACPLQRACTATVIIVAPRLALADAARRGPRHRVEEVARAREARVHQEPPVAVGLGVRDHEDRPRALHASVVGQVVGQPSEW